MTSNGVTILVSPFKSLIMGQVEKLKIAGYCSILDINSDLSNNSEIDNVLHQMIVSQPNLLYVTPERIFTPEFQTVS